MCVITRTEPTRELTQSEAIKTLPVKTLLQKIRKIADIHITNAVNEWEEQYYSLSEDKIKAASALLFLRTNTIGYLLCQSEDMQWLPIYNELTALAISHLPEHIQADAFIKRHETVIREMIRSYQSLQLIAEINSFYKNLNTQLQEEAIRIEQMTRSLFEKLKSALLNLNTEQIEGIEKLYIEMDHCRELIAAIYKQMEEQLLPLTKINLNSELLVHCEQVIDEAEKSCFQ